MMPHDFEIRMTIFRMFLLLFAGYPGFTKNRGEPHQENLIRIFSTPFQLNLLIIDFEQFVHLLIHPSFPC